MLTRYSGVMEMRKIDDPILLAIVTFFVTLAGAGVFLMGYVMFQLLRGIVGLAAL